MAARKSSTLSPRHRDAIKTSMLLNRLQAFTLCEKDPQTGKPVVMSRDQVAACATLLRKTMPDLAVMAHTGEGGGPVMMNVVTGVTRGEE